MPQAAADSNCGQVKTLMTSTHPIRFTSEHDAASDLLERAGAIVSEMTRLSAAGARQAK